MKKFLFAIIAVATFALTGCEKSGINVMDVDLNTLDNTTPKCWVYHIKEVKETSYIWCTERELVEIFQGYNNSGTENSLTVTYEESAADDQDACEAKNEY
jgi:hypothetical protein